MTEAEQPAERPEPEPVETPEPETPPEPAASEATEPEQTTPDRPVPEKPAEAEPPKQTGGRHAAPDNSAEPSKLDPADYNRFAGGSPAEPKNDGAPDQSWNSAARETPAADDQTFQAQLVGGMAAIGDNPVAVQVNLRDGHQIVVLRYHRSTQWIADGRATFVEPADFVSMRTTLKTERLLYLRGPRGSGRRRVAEQLLASVAGDDLVAGLEVRQPDVTLSALAGEPGLLLPEHGQVLELTEPGTVTAAMLAAFAALAQPKAYLVILGDHAGASDPELQPYEVQIEAPPAPAVLSRHLMFELGRRGVCKSDCRPCEGRCRREFIDECLSQELVQDELRANPQPAAVADLARALAGWDRTPESLGRTLDRIRVRVREAAAKLLQGADPKDRDDPQGAPRRQAVQIAYAAFDGLPLADVFEVGSLLLQVLWIAQHGREPDARVVFDDGIERMLRVPEGESVVRTLPHEHPRRVQFVDGRMPFELLDVVWNDFDGVRLPLMYWLNQLVTQARPGVRRRAAQLAGWLATLDFDEVWRKLINPWARSQNGAHRQAAAWAVDIIAYDGQLLSRLRARVRDWTRSNNPWLHDTAARSYGTRLGAAFLGDSLSDLGVLAGREDLNGSASVAVAMRFLYTQAPDDTVKTLIRWNGDDTYRIKVHAARSLIFLTDLKARPPRDRWPLLLADLVEAGDTSPLIDLWRAALNGPTTSFRAWKELHAWLQYADADTELREVLLDLCPRMLGSTTAGFHRRGRFNVRRWADTCETARLLLHLPWPDDNSGETHEH